MPAKAFAWEELSEEKHSGTAVGDGKAGHIQGRRGTWRDHCKSSLQGVRLGSTRDTAMEQVGPMGRKLPAGNGRWGWFWLTDPSGFLLRPSWSDVTWVWGGTRKLSRYPR